MSSVPEWEEDIEWEEDMELEEELEEDRDLEEEPQMERPVQLEWLDEAYAEKRYTTWEKGLFVVSLALKEVEKVGQQQPVVLRGPFEVIKTITTGIPPPDGVVQGASDLIEILEKIKKDGQKTLITVHHNVKEIHRVIERGIEMPNVQPDRTGDTLFLSWAVAMAQDTRRTPRHRFRLSDSRRNPWTPRYPWLQRLLEITLPGEKWSTRSTHRVHLRQLIPTTPGFVLFQEGATIRDLCKAHRDYGRDSPYFRGLLRSNLKAAVVIPADLRQLFSCLLDSTEFKLWEAAWRQLLREALPSLLTDPETAIDENGNALTLEQLMGEGRWTDPTDQASSIPTKALQTIREHAVTAFFSMVPDGPVIPYYKIVQGTKEAFTKFVEQLTRAIEVQVSEVAVREGILREMVFANANNLCRTAILSLPLDPPPTIQDMLQKPGKDKWRLLQDLCQINNVIEDMGSLQPGMPSPTMLPENWKLAIIDIKDCFFQIPLHPDDAPRFAFLVPTISREAPRKRYHWRVLPQGMKNSPVICQWYVASLLSPVRAAAGQAIIHHYMDDVLVCAPTDDVLTHALDLTINALIAAGFELQEEKVQRMPPWKYLGLEIGKRTIVPQKLAIKTKSCVRFCPHRGESGDVIKHLIHAFSFLGIPKGLKTDNSPAYKSRELCSFLQQWGVEHKTGIPHSPTVNHIIVPTEESPEEEGLELEQVLEEAPEDDGEDPDEEEHGLGYPTQHH
ncbi:hypothetical protein DUI87_13597 [Hirundo rustica rustica]|uniref:ribonuclease H n=1 Tax=Hirundo rustica rustica TaxID=333673 RepID=A0A3M0KFD8_HIRRU|nr:hypothetical protein DUI87_13597 [Hirundo rustica rustica]